MNLVFNLKENYIIINYVVARDDKNRLKMINDFGLIPNYH